MFHRQYDHGKLPLTLDLGYIFVSSRGLYITYTMMKQEFQGVYVIVVTWARGICLICMPEAQGLRAYISGKSRVHILQVICNTSGTLKFAQT